MWDDSTCRPYTNCSISISNLFAAKRINVAKTENLLWCRSTRAKLHTTVSTPLQDQSNAGKTKTFPSQTHNRFWFISPFEDRSVFVLCRLMFSPFDDS